MTDVTDEVKKVELDVNDSDETATIVLTSVRGTITVIGKISVVEFPETQT